MAERIGERRERRARRAATITIVALTVAVLSALAVGLSGPAHRFGLLGTRWAIGVFGVAGLASLAAAALALVGLVLALASRAWRSVAGTALALVLALAAAGPPLAALQKRGYPDLAPLMLAVSPGRAFARAEAAARSMGWRIVAAAPAEGRLEASDTTRWFGFTDDIVVRVTPAPNGSRIDVRSASRVGRSDLGVNARRIRAYLAALR